MREDVRCTPYGFGRVVDLSYEDAVSAAKEALKAEGFGVQCEIDIEKVMKEKRGVEFRPYVILGICNPELAHRALEMELDLGLLLPCNVVVYATEAGTVVQALNPEPVLGLVGNPALEPVANEVRARLQRVIDNVAGLA